MMNFIRKIVQLFLLVFLISCNKHVVISNHERDYFIKIQWAKYIAKDKIFDFTKITEQNGNFYFIHGLIDSLYNENNAIVTDLYSKINYKINYEFVKKVDTIYAYYDISFDKNYSLTESLIDLDYSYVINNISDSGRFKNLSIRLIDPLRKKEFPKGELALKNSITEYVNNLEIRYIRGNKDYEVIEIHYNDTMQIVKYNIISTLEGLSIQNYNSYNLKKKDIIKLSEYFKENILKDNLTCITPGHPWLLTYSLEGPSGRFLCSDFCLRNNSQLLKDVKLKYFIRSIALNYK
jgi:hypothetical protein